MSQTIPYISLSELVDDYCMATFNDRQKYAANYFIHAKWVWKKLFWNTLSVTTSRYCKVKSDESGRFYVDVPEGCVRIFSVNRVNRRGSMIPLLSDDQLNPLVANFENGVQCPQCGEDRGLSECCNDLSVATKPVVINGTSYVEKIWKKLDASGDFLQIREVPSLDYTDPQHIKVTVVTLSTKVCALDMSPCGCVRHTPHNQRMVQLYCGATSASMRNPLCQQKEWAGYKIVGGRIYFSFRGGVPDFALLVFQTNGECPGEEIMIPEYAVDTMTFGIHWRSGALAPAGAVSPMEKRERKMAYDTQVEDLQKFLNPIIPSEFLRVQMSIAKWGGLNIEPTVQFCPEPRANDTDERDRHLLTEADINLILDQRLAGLQTGGLQGPRGDKGEKGDVGTITQEFHFSQDTPAQVWDITHNLGFKPNIECENKQGAPLWGWTFEHVSDNRVIITHGIVVAGDAYLS